MEYIYPQRTFINMKKCSQRRKHCALPMQAGSVLHLCTEFEADCSIRSIVFKGNGNPKLGNQVTGQRPRAFRGRFMVPMQGGSVLYVCTQFEADSAFRSKVIRGSQNFEIGSRDPGQTHLGVVLFSVCRRVPSSVSVPNWKRIAQFVQKLLRGPEIRKLCHVTPATPTQGSFYGPYAGRFRPLCLYQI